MKNIIIGTAGHVDHGKTLLIKALTGIDTDRLKEEKKRGITIDLGFANLPLSNGEVAGIIDVPGHEKFIKNMLAGAGGMDLVLLVIAADEGVMPQTREHLGILSMLEVGSGIVALTKVDMVDGEWLEMVTEDIKRELAGTFLEGAPIMPVSAYTGDGIPELKETIEKMVLEASAKNTLVPFRIPVDRVFSVEGFGTVITGTLIEGTLSEGDEVMIYPSGVTTKVRNLQVHGSDVETAYAGQRTAVNLMGIKRTDIERGDCLAKPGSMLNTMMIDVRLSVMKESPHTVQSGSRLHFYYGSRNLLCKAVLLDTDALAPGESAFAQLRFSEEVSLKPGDRFVVRFYSPVDTVGGGTVLETAPARHRRFDPEVTEGLEVKLSGSSADRALQVLSENGMDFPTNGECAKILSVSPEEFERDLDELVSTGRAVRIDGGHTMSAQVYEEMWQKADRILAGHHAKYPLQRGMKIEEFRGKFIPGKEIPLIDGVAALYGTSGRLKIEGGRVSLASFEVKESERHKKARERILEVYLAAGYESPSTDEVYAMFPAGEKEIVKQVLESLVDGGEIVVCSPQIAFHAEVYRRAGKAVKKFFEQKDSITLGEFRDLLGTSRKYALAILEYWDRRGVTRKSGDERALVKADW